ncbi:MAG: DUF2252 domain-containing protein [Rhodobacterales bacterium]|nr:DUF2252 domain-containing protein [Rhodobacterales bacterium]
MSRALPLLIVLCACVPDEPVPDFTEDSSVPDIEAWNAWQSDNDKQRKYCKMSESPYAFFRGTNHLWWTDLGEDERLLEFGNPQTATWIQGDAHVLNYGSFDDNLGNVVYDLNDFDEAVIFDHQMDVWRLATSMVLLSDQVGVFHSSTVIDAMDAMSEEYLDTMDDLATDIVVSSSFTEGNTKGSLSDFLDDVQDDHGRVEMLANWTDVVNGQRLLVHDELRPATDDERQVIVASLLDYQDSLTGGLGRDGAYFTVVDVARRVNQGLGSLGTPRYYVLIEGATVAGDDDRILDFKRQAEPAAAIHLSEGQLLPASLGNHGHRVSTAQRALGLHADDHLGDVETSLGFFSVRERSPFKDALDPENDLPTAEDFIETSEQWGLILATSHGRSDEDFDPSLVPWSVDAAITASVDTRHDDYRELVREVAIDYAEYMTEQHHIFRRYVDDVLEYDCSAYDEDDG